MTMPKYVVASCLADYPSNANTPNPRSPGDKAISCLRRARRGGVRHRLSRECHGRERRRNGRDDQGARTGAAVRPARPMSGIVGHSMYAVLGLKAADAAKTSPGRDRPATFRQLRRRRLSRQRHSGHAGSGLRGHGPRGGLRHRAGWRKARSPAAPCASSGSPLRTARSPRIRCTNDSTGARTSCSAGPKSDEALRVPWDHLPDYFAAVIDDAFELFGPGERPLAYALGWIVHVVSDSLIKGIQPGIELNLVDGRYTARNRPVQDLFTFHEIGIREFHLDWAALFRDLAAHARRAVAAPLHALRRIAGAPRPDLPGGLAARGRARAPCRAGREPALGAAARRGCAG